MLKPEEGFQKLIFSISHKDIKTLYLIFRGFADIIGGCMYIFVRTELSNPKTSILLDIHQFYNVLITAVVC